MTKKLWFKRKRYGWGWVPASWEGWACIGVIFGVILFFGNKLEQSENPQVLAYLPMGVLLILVIIGLGYMKGERPKWQWGGK